MKIYKEESLRNFEFWSGAKENAKEFTGEHLDELEGVSVYACDLAYTLAESDNINGTMTYSTKAAIDYIREWWYDCADYSDYEEMNFGKRSNPFANPEAFMVRMVIEGINSILSQCEMIDENWNDEIELTPEVIEAIKEQIKDKEVRF